MGMAQCPEPTLSSDPPPIHAPMPFIAVDAEMLLGSPKECFPKQGTTQIGVEMHAKSRAS